MKSDVFNRYENKYLIDDATFKLIKEELNNYMSYDKYNMDDKIYTIHSVYLDTIDDNYIRTSLAKPKYKEKVRIRSYNTLEESEFVYLEIKKKFDGVGNKRRTKLKLEEAVSFLQTGIIPEYKEYMNLQVLHELEYIFSKDKLEPKTTVTYDRIAYFNNDGHDLRITFDTNIVSKRIGKKEHPLLDDNMWLMEIKAQDSYPVWVVKLLSKYNIKKTSFSKYGKDYEYMLNNNNKTNYNDLYINSELEKAYINKEKYYNGIDFRYEYC